MILVQDKFSYCMSNCDVKNWFKDLRKNTKKRLDRIWNDELKREKGAALERLWKENERLRARNCTNRS